MAIYVSLTVDDLDNRNDPKHSDRTATYKMSKEDIQTVLALIRKYGSPVRTGKIEERVPELWEDAAS